MDAFSLFTAGQRHASSATRHPWAAVSPRWRLRMPREGRKVPRLLSFPLEEKKFFPGSFFFFFGKWWHHFSDRISCRSVTLRTLANKISTGSTSPNCTFYAIAAVNVIMCNSGENIRALAFISTPSFFSPFLFRL